MLIAAAVYILLGRCVLRLRGGLRDLAFAMLNVVGVYLFFFYDKDPRFTLLFNLFFASYFAIICVQYLALRIWSQRAGLAPWLAFSVPIAVLVAVRYAPLVALSRWVSVAIHDVLQRHPEFTLGTVFVGVSYLVFRTSHLVFQVRNGVVPRPDFWQYLGYAFFVPTMPVGPINAYSQHRQAFADAKRPQIPIGRALLRMLVGAVKYSFLAPLFNQLSYAEFLLDGHPHLWVDLPIAAIAYYLYLYLNFSGFCDMAIGAAGLMGIPVAENFAHPFAARNVKDFWNRWHITLSQWMRDIVFAPLCKMLVRLFGPTRVNHAIAVTILVVFLLVGIWHGAGWNYAAFGAAHGLGVAANHYYTLALKVKLGKERFAAYNHSRVVQTIAVSLTFLYVTATLFLFANDGPAMHNVFAMLRLH
jgi:D-alanyl-lipoteichoic acid acyltransferase DltB (MBOAT superfamily)